MMDELVLKRIVDSPPVRVREALKRLAVSYCRIVKSSKMFCFQGREYPYLYHAYNMAWRNERSLEIPVAMDFVLAHRGHAVLEVGNVLSHYTQIDHDVLDKYEVAEGVINEDAADFAPGKKYDLIMCISTLEHIGMYESRPDPGQVQDAVSNLAGLLAPGGMLVATVPLGLNTAFDSLLERGAINFDEVYALKRRGMNNWSEVDFRDVKGAKYSRYRFRANALVVGIIRNEQNEENL
jgi:hypothetical protein